MAQDGGTIRAARLSARDWADAALDAMRAGGLAAVAVEPLAVRLGTTKGSFYWHFANRDALIDAALARWEDVQTEAVIASTERRGDVPEERIRSLFQATTYTSGVDPVELVLLADTAHPQVAATLQRVSTRRLDYLTTLFSELGLGSEAARHRALMAYMAYLGHAQLAHAVPDVLPEGESAVRYLDEVLETLLRREEG